MSADIEIRPATRADRAAVVALLEAQFGEHEITTAGAALERAVDPVIAPTRRGRILLALAGERAIGLAAVTFVWSFEHGGRSSWLEELYVEPAFRNRGTGARLLDAACRAAEEAGAAAVDLEVAAGHDVAGRLYARAGFEPLARARWVRRLAPSPRGTPTGTVHAGGCFCGAVRYVVDAPPAEVSHCHCTICRRTTGAPFVTWATFPAGAFRLTSGTPTELRSSPHAVRTFCAACGTALTFREPARPTAIDVAVGSLDAPDAVPPRDHIWTSSQLVWLALDDELPRHPGEAEHDG